MNNASSIRFGIVGCGAIGHKRAKALKGLGLIAGCADTDVDKSQAFAAAYCAAAFKNSKELLVSANLDAIIIATLHESLAQIALAAIEAGLHVFVEKPAAKLSRELIPLMLAAKEKGVVVRVGFNHRFHRSVQKAKEIIDSGVLGELMFIRGRYGHGGRVGYDQEWRAKPELSGGGELIDQGPHLIDLSRWFLGEFTDISGFAHTYFWNMPVDDNGFLILKTKSNQVAFLHASCTEWKNLFSMEIYGKLGKIDLSGLGGSYGIEKITHYQMTPEMGPPQTSSWEYPMEDNSWALELSEFIKDIQLGRKANPGLEDAFEALKIVEKIYKDSGYDNCA